MIRQMAVVFAALFGAGAAARSQTLPLIDYHQHLVSPAAAARSPTLPPIFASDLVRLLDSAGIRRALVLSVAYQFGNPNRPPVDSEYAAVRAENDWTSAQVAQFPARLRGFCGVNPLKDYAIDEITRCATDSRLRSGLKLHFGNSDVDLDNSDHVARLKRVFKAANDHGMAVVVHMHASVDKRRPYGAREARVMLTEVLPAAPTVPVQIAHLAGAGTFDDSTDAALGVFIDAIAQRDARMTHVWFDASAVASDNLAPERAARIAARIRAIGVDRVLYGSDAATNEYSPKRRVTSFLRLPLTDAEFRTIASNVAPYMK